jgi:hypothetical protein
MHLLIPYASTLSDACQQTLATLKLPQLDKLLRQLQLTATDSGDASSLTPPHERALAAAQGIYQPQVTPDGQVPWGAWHAAQAGHTVQTTDDWAVITPCHWAVQSSHITMISPRALNLQADESRQLLAAMQPYFEEDGITLLFDTATRWLARGPVFANLATASPYRVLGDKVDDWVPQGDAARGLRRLQQEMQMLLYTHALTDARASRGALAVNSFWVSGTGRLPASPRTGQASTAPPVTIPTGLRDAAVRDDWAAWALAWQQIDRSECAQLLAALARGEAVSLTLCGQRSAQTFSPPRPGLVASLSRRILSLLAHKPSSILISSL